MMKYDADTVRRAWGCLLGQIAGDSLGSQVEFQKEEKVRVMFPMGMEDLEGSALYRTLPGQPTDDTEMALALARSLVARGDFRADDVREAYQSWLKSRPVDFAHAVFRAMHGKVDARSQANCALMRVSPLGIFGVRFVPDSVVPCADGAMLDLDAAVASEGLCRLADWAMEEASITNPHPLCRVANAAYVTALACGIRGAGRQGMWQAAVGTARRLAVCGDGGQAAAASEVLERLMLAATEAPADYQAEMSHVLVALQNGFWQLLHAEDAGAGVKATAMRGGDSAANAAVAGALLGAALDIDSFPAQWVDAVLACRPDASWKDVPQPRPEAYWPLDFMPLAKSLLG